MSVIPGTIPVQLKQTVAIQLAVIFACVYQVTLEMDRAVQVHQLTMNFAPIVHARTLQYILSNTVCLIYNYFVRKIYVLPWLCHYGSHTL